MGSIVSAIDACWASIAKWPALKDCFETKFECDEDLRQLNASGVGIGDIGEKFAVAIQEQPFGISPRETQALNFPIALKIEVWGSADVYRKTCDILEEIINSLFGARPSATSQTFVEKATCGPPQQIVGLTVTFANLPQGTTQNATDYPCCYGSAVVVFLTKIMVPT